MLVIYDLDKTSLYCPIADKLDNFIPKNKLLKRIYYSFYPIVHRLEIALGLLQVNRNMYVRAKQFEELGINQVVVTARHRSPSIDLHVKRVFRDVNMLVLCVAQGITGLSKADVVAELPIDDDELIVMYDDNYKELSLMNRKFRKRFTGIHTYFKDNKERIDYVY